MKFYLTLTFAMLSSLAFGGLVNPKYDPQESVLARQSLGNFGCKVDSVKVTLDSSGDEDNMPLTVEDIESHVSRTASLEWAHVNQFFFASLDGRNEEKNMGTPGGDMGEFILALNSFTKVTGVTLAAEEVDALFEKYLKIMSRQKFFYETDENAYRKLAIDTGCKNLKIASLGDKRKKQAILDSFAAENMEEYIGDPFIKYLAQNFEELGVRKEYISLAIQAYHRSLWKQNTESNSLCYYEVKGKNDPKALVNVKTPGFCVDQGLAPLISSQMCSGQVFVNHPDAVRLYRRELVQLVSRPEDNPSDILSSYNLDAEKYFTKFLEQYSDLAVFTVQFQNSNFEEV